MKMPPRVRITKEEIVDVALSMIRSEGEASLNARSIAAALGCSTQPIFSNFETMEALRESAKDFGKTVKPNDK
jgi:AcrR family transcriptional regulator